MQEKRFAEKSISFFYCVCAAIEVAAHRPGLWEDSRISSKGGRLYFKKNGTIVRVIAKNLC